MSGKAARRVGVFDRDQSKREAKVAMDVLWALAKAAKADLDITKFEAASYVASLEIVELELQSLLAPLGMKAVLPDGIENVTRGKSTGD